MSEMSKEYGGVLPCGGKGTRLESINPKNLPKSLFKVAGKELIQYSINTLPARLVGQLVFAVDDKAEALKSWAEAAELPQTVEFSEQTKPGVLEAIVEASYKVRADSMVACNTDEIRLGLNFEDIAGFHEQQGTLATMVTTYSKGLSRHRFIERNDDGIVTTSRLKPEEYRDQPEAKGLVNTGFLFLEKQAMDYFDASHSRDWSGIIDPLTEAGQLSAFVNPHLHYFNVGTPEEYLEAERFLEQHS
jgi:NDP-sugar pyrophosphorylase family protein